MNPRRIIFEGSLGLIVEIYFFLPSSFSCFSLQSIHSVALGYASSLLMGMYSLQFSQMPKVPSAILFKAASTSLSLSLTQSSPIVVLSSVSRLVACMFSSDSLPVSISSLALVRLNFRDNSACFSRSVCCIFFRSMLEIPTVISNPQSVHTLI